MIERLRIDLEAARDQMAEDVFLTLLNDGQIEFRLRADATDCELPEAMPMQIAGELALTGAGRTKLVCDLVFDAGWRGTLNNHYFSEPQALS